MIKRKYSAFLLAALSLTGYTSQRSTDATVPSAPRPIQNDVTDSTGTAMDRTPPSSTTTSDERAGEKERARGNTPPGMDRAGQRPAIVDPAGVTKQRPPQ